MPTTFYIVRHGQSEGNVNGDIMGTDPPLTEKGIKQAKTLAKVLASVAIDQIFTSNLLRAKQTAKIIADQKKSPVFEFAQIRERFFGKLEGQKGDAVGKNYRQQIDKFNQISLIEQLRWRIVEDMESLEEVLGRVLPFFDEIANTNRQKTILLVTHANVMLSLLAHFSFVN